MTLEVRQSVNSKTVVWTPEKLVEYAAKYGFRARGYTWANKQLWLAARGKKSISTILKEVKR